MMGCTAAVEIDNGVDLKTVSFEVVRYRPS